MMDLHVRCATETAAKGAREVHGDKKNEDPTYNPGLAAKA